MNLTARLQVLLQTVLPHFWDSIQVVVRNKHWITNHIFSSTNRHRRIRSD